MYYVKFFPEQLFQWLKKTSDIVNSHMINEHTLGH